MPKKTGIIFVTAGAVLMMSALSLILYNMYDEYRSAKEAEIMLDGIQSAISEQITEDLNSAIEEMNQLSPEMPVVEIDGYGYIGYLSIPQIELELPVMNKWSYSRLKMAPCRHFGSSRTDDLVIAAHNYKSFFKRLHELEVGSEVFFTDMDGIVNTYSVTKMETLDPTAVEEVQKSGHDLVLYTCTPGGATRVVAFCDRVE